MTAQTTSAKWVDATAGNQFTDSLELGAGEREVFITTSGTFSATVSVQVKRPDQASWRTIHTITTPGAVSLRFRGPLSVRAGVATGDHTSGTAEVELA